MSLCSFEYFQALFKEGMAWENNGEWYVTMCFI